MIKKLWAQRGSPGKILAKGGITFFFRIVAMLFSFGIMWFITNYFGDSVFGLYSLGLTILQFAVLVFAMGVPNAFISFTGGFSGTHEHVGFLLKAVKTVLVAAALPLLVLTLSSGFISEYIFNKPNLWPFLVVAGLGTPVLILHELLCFYFISVKRFTLYGLFIFIIPNVLFAAFLLMAYYSAASPYIIFGSYVAAYVINITIGFTAAFYKVGAVAYPAITTRHLLRKALPMMMGGVFLMLLNWTDILILGRYETEANIGIYNAAFRIGYLVLFFVSTMNVIILPKISELYYQKDFAGMKKAVNSFTQMVGLATIPLAAAIIFFSSYILSFLGKDFNTGSTALTLITLGGLYNAMTGNVDQILNMTDNQTMVSKILFAGFFLNVLLNLYLVPQYGINGAAWASLLSNIFVNTVFVIVIKKKLGFWTFI
ncbi:polysaccharide biosynthesis C-terminal domain-containing protein [Flavobacterium sp. RHBU_24]|uniref:oligosaccharide flippase family protein n=1 Tax=Flavobacterium sp. RHBU_24 TaxID=3391185 RepID=UPI003984D624